MSALGRAATHAAALGEERTLSIVTSGTYRRQGQVLHYDNV